MEENAKKGKSLWYKIPLIILAVILVIGASGIFYLNSKLNLIRRDEPIEVVNPEDEYFETDEPDVTNEPDKTSEPDVGGELVDAGDDTGNAPDDSGSEVIDPAVDVVDPHEVEWPVDENVMHDKNIINILLIGQDRRPGEKRARSDSMMIATINKKDKTVKITSLMRDMYVQIPGYSDNRINASYAFGGMKLLDATIEKNFLIKVDGNIEVDFTGFQQVIDTIGGVDIAINEKEADYLRKSGFPDLTAGTVHMDGKLALAYARIRKVGNSDYERTERQRRVITTAFARVKTLPFDEITGLINKLFPLINTDMSNMELISLAYNVFLINPDTIGTNRIPVDNSFRSAKIRGMLVLVPDLEKNRKALRDIIYGK